VLSFQLVSPQAMVSATHGPILSVLRVLHNRTSHTQSEAAPTGPCGFSHFAVVASLSQMLAKAHGSHSACLSSWQLRLTSHYQSLSPPGDDECLANKLLVLPVLSLDSDTVVRMLICI